MTFGSYIYKYDQSVRNVDTHLTILNNTAVTLKYPHPAIE
jgi:hypothetical protein